MPYNSARPTCSGSFMRLGAYERANSAASGRRPDSISSDTQRSTCAAAAAAAQKQEGRRWLSIDARLWSFVSLCLFANAHLTSSCEHKPQRYPAIQLPFLNRKAPLSVQNESAKFKTASQYLHGLPRHPKQPKCLNSAPTPEAGPAPTLNTTHRPHAPVPAGRGTGMPRCVCLLPELTL